jgi:GcrA cell cycle regulator
MMGWNNEEVEKLKRLWTDGLSASEIAKEFGGITRNAVIGKVHRLGLSRANPSDSMRTSYSLPKPVQHATRPREKATQAEPVTDKPASNGPQEELAPPSRTCPLDAFPGLATAHTLGAHMCKWPIGDPLEEGFTYCGRKCKLSSPFCLEHEEFAYQPASTPRKRKQVKFYRPRIQNNEAYY